jgi:hypothetical protein
VAQAFGETRLREGRGGEAGWRRASSLLDEAAELLASPAGPGSPQEARLVASNRALVGRVLELPGWKRSLAAALGAVVEDWTPGDFHATYHLASATACGIAIDGSMAAQRRRIRDAWWGVLESQGPAVGGAIRCVGQAAFYLNSLQARDGNARHANEGIMATDSLPPHMAPPGQSIPLMFMVRPLRDVFDNEFIEASRRFIWEQGGPGLDRITQQIEALKR